MERALREKVFKRKNKIFFNLPNEETEGSWLDARLQSQGSSKILKLASELPFFHCDLNPISSDVDFECRFGLTDTVILEKIKNIEKIRIAILSANRTLSVKKLIDLGYRPFDYHERRVFVEGKDGDFEKMVDPETLEKELLEYAKEIEGWAKENDHYVFKFDTDLRIFLDYLEEELE